MFLIRSLAIAYAMKFIGTWYSWGGAAPDGFDCSGYMVEVLKSVGKIERKSDYTAQQLYDMFPKSDKPGYGKLAFWKKDGKVVHVELLINNWQTVGASGGGRNTVTREDAIRDGAFIKVRPLRDNAHFADPF